MFVIGKAVGVNTNIVSHVPHQACGKIQKHDLNIHNATCARCIVQAFLGVCEDGRQNIFDESLQIGVIEEAKPSLSLDFP